MRLAYETFEWEYHKNYDETCCFNKVIYQENGLFIVYMT